MVYSAEDRKTGKSSNELLTDDLKKLNELVLLGGTAGIGSYEDILRKKHSKVSDKPSVSFKPSEKQRRHRQGMKMKKQMAAKSRKRNRNRNR